MTQDDKMQYIDKFLENDENILLGIKREGNSFQIGGVYSGDMMMWTGVSGCYNYLIEFEKVMLDNKNK